MSRNSGDTDLEGRKLIVEHDTVPAPWQALFEFSIALDAATVNNGSALTTDRRKSRSYYCQCDPIPLSQ
jgi:hypothetical protein